MGTVGLSFGSPTSGAGFDVSATVASIVSNLQNVETPWKTQLTSLQSQDSAISNLGTLLSAVSNDLSQLTDYSGIMAQKMGSSSDTNVLELTSATSSAQAGTHTVVVEHLATTSSGYMDTIANTADLLSGSIVLQVGSGTTKTITLDSTDDTLSGLAQAINASGVGISANVLTDSSGSRLSLVSGTSGSNGNISVVSNSITDTTNNNTKLGYTSPTSGSDATIVVDGATLTSASNTIANLIPGLTFQILATSSQDSSGNYTPVQVEIGNNTTGAYSAITAFVSDYNALVNAIDVQQGNDASGNAEPLFGSPTLSLLQQQLMSGINTQNPNGTMDAVSTSLDVTLSGSIVLQVGTGSAQTISVSPSNDTLSGLAASINSANIGVTATVVTSNGMQTLTLASQQTGSSGALSITSSITATADTALSYIEAGTMDSVTPDSGTVSIAASGDLLSGSLVIQVGSGAAQTISVDSSSNTLAGLAAAINNSSLGVTAAVNAAGTGLTLTSPTNGTAGELSITSNLLDTTNTSSTVLGYTTSSDISTLASLGLGVSSAADGTLSLDAVTLDSLLNSDFSGVVGFFQGVDSWGADFSNMLDNAGTSSSNGMLSLALSANSASESTLNTDISREDSLISAESKSLTLELNSANEILQEIPQQLSEVNMIYSAITGYGETSS